MGAAVTDETYKAPVILGTDDDIVPVSKVTEPMDFSNSFDLGEGTAVSTPVYIPKAANEDIEPAPAYEGYVAKPMDFSNSFDLGSGTAVSTPVFIPPAAKEPESSGSAASQPSNNATKSAVIFSGGFVGGVLGAQLLKNKKDKAEPEPQPKPIVKQNNINYLPILAGLFLIPVLIKAIKR